jgi:hypothetical protein
MRGCSLAGNDSRPDLAAARRSSRRRICFNLPPSQHHADPLGGILRCIAADIHAAFISLNAG